MIAATLLKRSMTRSVIVVRRVGSTNITTGDQGVPLREGTMTPLRDQDLQEGKVGSIKITEGRRTKLRPRSRLQSIPNKLNHFLVEMSKISKSLNQVNYYGLDKPSILKT